MINKTSIFVLLVALSLLIGPASATQYVNQGDNNTVIQEKINNATDGEKIIFEAGPLNYTGISLTVATNNLKFKGNGATLVGSGSSIFTISGTTGVTIKNFFININSTTGGDGITGSNVYNATIKNNVITKGDDGINIFMGYGGLKIINNTITNMTTGRDGISLVNHFIDLDMNTLDPTVIKNNNINTVQYGIWLGGNFKGFIIGNDVNGTINGLNITGRAAANNGKLNATIHNNTIIGGIAMESPHVLFLNLCHNIIGQVAGTGYSIFDGRGQYNKEGPIYVENNDFTDPVFDIFRWFADTWSDNFLNGTPYPQFP